ncbi:MAG: histidine kinase [Ignavibacteria bacterium]
MAFEDSKHKNSDSVYNITRNISFPEYVKDIRISVTSFDINSAGNLEYFYKLNDQDTIWNKTNDNVITFPSLAYGNYNFQIYAANTFGKRSEASLLNFTVETPFTKSFIFYALISLSAMSLTGYTVSRSFKKKYLIEKERNTFKNQISDLKQRSLVSMMNPHFVFNSLNSIQSFYNYKENESANEYLAKFSRLIRMNLDFADKTFIRLSDEIERLESYLLLEKMRFNDNLNYEIWVSDDIDPEKTKIPNMIIQPFVENAIWHGILKSQLAGEVKVNIFHSQLPEDIRKNYQIQVHSSLKGSKTDPIDPNPAHCIKIEIIDNGAGINNSRKNRSSN